MENTNDGYTTIKLPKEFAKLIDELVDDEKLGFSSRTEVVKSAVRDYYERMKKFGKDSTLK